MNLSSVEFKIRRATLQDVDAIVALVESVYRGESSRQGWTTEADIVEGQRTDSTMIQEMMDKPGQVFFVTDRKPQGLAASVFLEKKKEHTYLGMLAVAADLQNHKLGRKLIAHCEQQTRDWGLPAIKITVIPQRVELIQWYERLGFQRTGRDEAFPTDPRYGVPKNPDLHFVELAKQV